MPTGFYKELSRRAWALIMRSSSSMANFIQSPGQCVQSVQSGFGRPQSICLILQRTFGRFWREQNMSSEQCSKPLLVDYLMGLYNPKISRGVFTIKSNVTNVFTSIFPLQGRGLCGCLQLRAARASCAWQHTLSPETQQWRLAKSSSGTRREKRCWLQWFLHGIFSCPLCKGPSVYNASWHLLALFLRDRFLMPPFPET